ncbi:MAG: hypothetical protein NUV80_00995 [Candidatus Berkelbacteria bacterium]|nr:hypothetical protein [Candidatus Berkelbacteria bacterium]
MKKLLQFFLPSIIVSFLCFSLVFASNVFPVSLNDWADDEVIESGWADALEDKIGVDSSAVATSLDYLIKNTSSKLGKIASLAVTDGNFIVADGTNWVAESGATARTSLGLGSSDAVTFGTLDTGQGANELYDMDQDVLTTTTPTFVDAIFSSLTASELVATTSAKALQSLSVGTYPSLTEISYVKGVTSAIQTQFTGKASTTLNNLGTTAINASLLLAGDATYDIGSSTVGINDIHFGLGGIINFDGSDVTLTHSANTLTLDGGTLALGANQLTGTASIQAGAYAAASVDGDDIASGIAGRSLTLTAASPDTLDADVELYRDTKCYRIETPVATDDDKSIWFAKGAFTLTSIWAESDQTVTFMLQVDDGTVADVDSVDLAPAAGTAEDTALNGDATMAAGDRLDLDLVSVSGTPTWVSICWTGTWDD